jgi:cell division septation protein DedD
MTMRVLNRTLVVIAAVACVGISGCSRESRDWRSAQAADSLESYDHFLELHPDSELAAQARARLLQLTEDRDWQRAGTADTADAYRQFLNQHPNGKWSAEARIRAENFALEDQPITTAAGQSTGAPTGPSAPSVTAPTPGSAAIRASAPPVGAVSPSAGSASMVSTSTPSDSVASSSTASTGFGIQLGAFSSEDKAHSEWQRLQSEFANELTTLQPHLVPVNVASGNLFRLQAHTENEAQARAVCAALAEKSQACVVVLPQH